MNRLIPITIIVPVEKLGLSDKLSEGYHDNEDLFELTIDVPFDHLILHYNCDIEHGDRHTQAGITINHKSAPRVIGLEYDVIDFDESILDEVIIEIIRGEE